MENKKDNYKGFYKVRSNGGTLVFETFYNPTTNEVMYEATRDYDYDDGMRDIDELYDLPMSQWARRLFDRHMGIMNEGDQVLIFKGRKMLNEHKTIKYFYTIKVQTYMEVEYVRFTDGSSVALDNVKLDLNEPRPTEVEWKQVKEREE